MEELDEIGELVLRCLDRMEKEGAGAVEAVCQEHPDQAAALRSRLRFLSDAGLLDEGSAQESMPERLGEYRVLERLGGGGMGVVYRAVQESSDRVVALKVMRPDHAGSHAARERFRREMQIASRLQHPGIVRVYAVGEDHGVPYFTMDCVDGCSLEDVLGHLAGQDPSGLDDRALLTALQELRRGGDDCLPPATSRFAGPWVEVCVSLLCDAAAALQHAHEQGVLHRDVKPSNLLLSTDGRVLLADFGLAQAEDAHKLTRTGTHIGSLPYMAPEVIRGEPADLRTDVYGVGVTLYELLTLDVPFRGGAREALMKAILEGRPEPLERRNPGVSRDLVTVCRQAMDVDRARRYATMQDLADDLRRVLDQEPVRARRPGLGTRVLRYGQRHPERFVAALVTVGVLFAALIALVVQRSLANQRITGINQNLSAALASLQTEKQRTDQENARAEANLQRALQAVRVMLSEVGSNTLEHVPGLEQKRQQLLHEALALYEQLLDQVPSRREWASLQRSSGDVLLLLGRLDEAREAYRRHLEVYREVCRAEPDDEFLAHELAGALSQLGNVEVDAGDLAAAADCYHEALDILEGLVRAEPDATAFADSLRIIRRNLGNTYRLGARWADAVAAYRPGLEEAERNLKTARFTGMSPMDACALIAGLADSLGHLGDTDAARSLFERAYAELVQLAGAHGADPRTRDQASTVGLNFGGMLHRTGDLERAAEVLEEARQISDRLVSESPAVPEYREHCAQLCSTLGLVRGAQGETQEGLALCEEGLDLFLALQEDFPSAAPFHYGAASALLNLAQLALESEDAAWALDSSRAAVEELGTMQRMAPDWPVHAETGQALLHQASALILLDRIDEVAGVLQPVAELVRSEAALLRSLAEVYADACTALAAQDATDSEEFAVLRAGALESLGLAVAAGYADVRELRGARGLEVLREDPALEALLQRIPDGG